MQHFIKDVSAEQLWGYMGLLVIIWLLIVWILYKARRIDNKHKADKRDAGNGASGSATGMPTDQDSSGGSND